jgi:hypothetical protein
MVAGTGAGHIEQMPLGLVDFFEVGIVGDILDPLLRRDDRAATVGNVRSPLATTLS